MSILKILGKVGAVAAGGAALFLAGKSGLGESLFNGKEDIATDDLEDTLQPTETTEETETVDTTTEQEASD